MNLIFKVPRPCLFESLFSFCDSIQLFLAMSSMIKLDPFSLHNILVAQLVDYALSIGSWMTMLQPILLSAEGSTIKYLKDMLRILNPMISRGLYGAGQQMHELIASTQLPHHFTVRTDAVAMCIFAGSENMVNEKGFR